MIIPIKCFTCNNVIGDKYGYYQNAVRQRKIKSGLEVDKVIYLTKKNLEKTAEGLVLDELELFDACCRRHMLTHVDIE